MDELLLNVESKETRCAVLRNGRLHDFVVERRRSRRLTGNVYRGRVTNMLHNIQSAFIDIGENENGFIHISDILENRKKFEQMFDMDFELESQGDEELGSSDEESDIQQLLRPDQSVLVQVVKEPIGSKGARLTAKVSIPGRYLVLLPNTPHVGVSRRIEDRTTRERLKRIVRSLQIPNEMGLICRTASQQASHEALLEEAAELLQSWQQVVQGFESTDKPTLLFEESDLIKRMILMAVDKRFSRVLIDHYATYQRCKQIYAKYASEHPLRLEFYRDKVPMFERFSVEKEIDRALHSKVWLPSGGYLYFDHTEAMQTIDVNSGRSGSPEATMGVEEALVQVNLDAAEEIARQLRIRNIGGLIIIDFIDMRSRRNKRRVLDRLRECMNEDSAKCTILPASDFGLVEMTRQRSREALSQTMFISCPYCSGLGRILSHESVVIQIERGLRKAIAIQQQFALRLVSHPCLDRYMRDEGEFDYLTEMAEELRARLEFGTDDTMHLSGFALFSTTSGREIEV